MNLDTASPVESPVAQRDDHPLPWTVWVWQETVVGIWPAGMAAPVKQAEMMARLSRCPVITYAVDRSFGRPVMGADVPQPTELGWVEVGRVEPGRGRGAATE